MNKYTEKITNSFKDTDFDFFVHSYSTFRIIFTKNFELFRSSFINMDNRRIVRVDSTSDVIMHFNPGEIDVNNIKQFLIIGYFFYGKLSKEVFIIVNWHFYYKYDIKSNRFIHADTII
jgi:hypothetical protein